MSSFKPIGSITAPERIWAPISEPFSIRQTDTSWLRSAASCLRRIAAASPAGPPPTITTSYSIDSRAITISLAVPFLVDVPAGADDPFAVDSVLGAGSRPGQEGISSGRAQRYREQDLHGP